MSIQYAASLIKRVGPSHIFIDREPNAALVQELVLQGCRVSDLAAADTERGGADVRRVGILQWPGARIGAAAVRRYASMDVLVLVSGDHQRPEIDQCLFANGWARHAAGMMSGEQAQFTDHTLPGTSYYQRIAPDAAHRRTVFRKSHADADLFLARYATAAKHVRSGDHVLIDGEQCGDAITLLAALSRASAVTCTTQRPMAVPDAPPLDVTLVEPDLARIPDHTMDIVIALEPATPDGWQQRLRDYARILRFDGRIVIGWKQDDRAGNGRIPAGWDELHAEACEQFLPEFRYIQRTHGDRRIVQAVGVDNPAASDWMMLVGSVNPLDGEAHRDLYVHHGFPVPRVEGGPPAVIDFGGGYDNPYLYRTMVQIGERLHDEAKLARMAECVVEDARPDSADRGAAIAVLGYRIFEQRLLHHVAPVLDLIGRYHEHSAAAADQPHVARWRLSLAFLAGRLAELVEDRAGAIAWYHLASESDWASFSPLLATKAIASAFYEARLHLSDGDVPAARICFQRGVATTLAAAQSSHAAGIGDPECPIPFYLQELAEVMDMGSQCANAVANLSLWPRDPGAFWRTVDVRRFGLSSWARDLQKENDRLRQAA
ncbi:MAG TPA: hypothetical protein VF649_12230 [Sphingomonas sp.]|uniref:hypothetical protein n=1 Tax=Sphingomonas sp. TaxID=28214 RepID=UPI002EDB0808